MPFNRRSKSSSVKSWSTHKESSRLRRDKSRRVSSTKICGEGDDGIGMETSATKSKSRNHGRLPPCRSRSGIIIDRLHGKLRKDAKTQKHDHCRLKWPDHWTRIFVLPFLQTLYILAKPFQNNRKHWKKTMWSDRNGKKLFKKIKKNQFYCVEAYETNVEQRAIQRQKKQTWIRSQMAAKGKLKISCSRWPRKLMNSRSPRQPLSS